MRCWSLAYLCTLLVLLQACTQGPALRGQIAGLTKLTQQAERNGAVRCAPRELATAQSQLAFAEIELDQGFISKAKRHVEAAEPNAHAAVALSPPQYCAERTFVEPPEPEPVDGDADGDGIKDSVDSCLLEPEDIDQYLDEDGCPEVDNDLDELLDDKDQCPNEPEDPDGYEDEDGCPDLDNDQDQVPDLQDQCPNEVGSTTKEPLGCPEASLAVVTDCEVKITQQIHFDFDKATIRPESYPVLNAVVDVLERNPAIKIEVQGHTDNRGTAKYNKDLSNRRAGAVMDYLIKHGIMPERLTSKGYGFDRPLVPNTTARERALNRRVQFVRTEGSKEGCPKTGDQ